MTFAKGELVAERFEVIRLLGAGGLAEVFLARDRVTGQEVALKALHAHLLFDEGLKERFRRELAVTRQLDHPGIVRVYDLYEHQGRPFFVMEHLRGETLAERLRTGAMPPEEARRIAAEICEALSAAHRKGVVHRDLKPQNIFLAETGAERPQVKLLDFGLARAAGWARLTAQSTVMGTPGYAAPEVIAGGGSDPRSDVYSLGATLFEMLTGRRAFPSADPYEALRRQREAPPSPRALDNSLAAGVDAVVRRALDPDPEQRFSDAAQMRQALLSGRVPQPARVPPAMTAGTYRLMVHRNSVADKKQAKREMEKLVWILGRDETTWAVKVWMERIGIYGSAPLLEGCSNETAQTVAALCQERGIPVTIEHDTPRATSLATGFMSIWIVGLTLQLLGEIKYFSNPIFLGGAAVLGVAAAGYLAVLKRTRALFKDLPPGDPAVRRLLDGIVRRAGRLSERQKDAPEAVQYLRDDLVRAANELVVEAEALGARAASIPDALAPLTPLPIGAAGSSLALDSEAPTLISKPRPEERDYLVGHLLEIAAALDEALAASATSREAAGVALARLQDETRFARRVLPEIEATLRGEESSTLLLAPPPDTAVAPDASHADRTPTAPVRSR